MALKLLYIIWQGFILNCVIWTVGVWCRLPDMRYCLLLLMALVPLCTCEIQDDSGEESVFEREERRLERCLSSNQLHCIQNLALRPLEDIWLKDEVKLMDSVFLEQVSHNASLGSGRESSGSDGKMAKTRALRVDLGNWGSLQVARSEKNPDNLELALHMVTGARGKRSSVLKIALPLMLGFKMTGMLIVSIIAVKILLVKALVVSKFALFAAGYLVVRKLLNKRQSSHNTPYAIPYYHETHPGLEAAAIGDYGYYSYGPSSHGEPDLQAHFSGNVPETVVAANHTDNRRGGIGRHPAVSLVKSRLNPVSVVTYRRVTHTGRSAQQVLPTSHSNT